jgi:hypothetical protein
MFARVRDSALLRPSWRSARVRRNVFRFGTRKMFSSRVPGEMFSSWVPGEMFSYCQLRDSDCNRLEAASIASSIAAGDETATTGSNLQREE